MLKAAKRQRLNDLSLGGCIEQLYLMDGTNTIFYMYERNREGEVVLLQVQLFCPELYDLTIKQGSWDTVPKSEIDALLEAQCKLLQRTANLLKQG